MSRGMTAPRLVVRPTHYCPSQTHLAAWKFLTRCRNARASRDHDLK